MSDSQDRRTEDPTHRQLQRARDDGQIVRSQDVVTAAVLASGGLAIWFGRGWVGGNLERLIRFALEYPARSSDGSESPDVLDAALQVALIVADLSYPIILIAVLAAVLVGIIQARGLFAPAAVAPKVDRLNPVKGLKELFSLRALVDLGKAVLKIVLLAWALFLTIRWSVGALVKLPYQGADGISDITTALFAAFFGTALLIFAVIAVFDFWLQKIIFMRSQRMTPEEVKRERHEDTGRPEIRSRRRQIAAEDVLNPLLERTAQASVIICESDGRCAVALISPSDPKALPWVVNKGIDHYAQAIVTVGRKAGLLVIVDGMLARRIHDRIAIDADLNADLNRVLLLHLARRGL